MERSCALLKGNEMADTHYCVCGEEGQVGVADDQGVTWLCMDHFINYLKVTRERIDQHLAAAGLTPLGSLN